jgi:hypothetical protein
VIPPPRPQFWVTDRENNATIMARVGDTFQIGLPSTLKTHSIDEWVMRKSTSQSMSLEALRGNTILPDRATTSFFLEAIAPGTARIEFQRAKGPPMTVDYLFKIAP